MPELIPRHGLHRPHQLQRSETLTQRRQQGRLRGLLGHLGPAVPPVAATDASVAPAAGLGGFVAGALLGAAGAVAVGRLGRGSAATPVVSDMLGEIPQVCSMTMF